jgi:Domain of unknown function (DUF222)/HNH endonuclease
MCSYMIADPEAALTAPTEIRKPLELLEREICELSAHMAVGMCRWLLLVAEFDEREGWAEWGVYSCAHWLSWRCSIGLRAAREHVRVARRLTALPALAAGFAAGELSYSKVRALSRIADANNEQYLLMLGRHSTGAQLEKIVCRYRSLQCATIDGARDAHRRRYLHCERDEDGSLVIQGRLPAAEGELLLAALAHAERSDQAGSAEPREDEPPSPEARRADALVSLARAELAGGAEHGAGGDPVELIVHVDADSLRSDEVQERSELARGPSIAPETARRLGCDAAVVRIIERDGRPLTVGRRTRTVPPALKRALDDRDPHCRFPGCTHERYLHAHHIQHWARGGPTNLENLVRLCPHHHRLVHEGGFTVRQAGRQTLFFRPDGRAVPDRPQLATPTGPGVVAQNRARGVHVSPTTCQPLSVGEPLDYGLAIDGLLDPPTLI